jgi:hypothetical protein
MIAANESIIASRSRRVRFTRSVHCAQLRPRSLCRGAASGANVTTSGDVVTSTAQRGLVGLLAKPAALTRAFSTQRPVRGWVVVCSALLPIVLTSGWVIADLRQSTDYSPIRQTVSVLSGDAATDRWIVTASLYLVGIGYLATAYGLTTAGTPARIGLIVAGAAALGVASFPEPAQGSSNPHAFCTAVGALTIAIWPALVARRDSLALAAVGLRTSITASVVSGALFCWTALEIGGSALGLAERMSSSMQVTWPFVIAVALRRASRARASATSYRFGSNCGEASE